MNPRFTGERKLTKPVDSLKAPNSSRKSSLTSLSPEQSTKRVSIQSVNSVGTSASAYTDVSSTSLATIATTSVPLDATALGLQIALTDPAAINIDHSDGVVSLEPNYDGPTKASFAIKTKSSHTDITIYHQTQFQKLQVIAGCEYTIKTAFAGKLTKYDRPDAPLYATKNHEFVVVRVPRKQAKQLMFMVKSRRDLKETTYHSHLKKLSNSLIGRYLALIEVKDASSTRFLVVIKNTMSQAKGEDNVLNVYKLTGIERHSVASCKTKGNPDGLATPNSMKSNEVKNNETKSVDIQREDTARVQAKTDEIGNDETFQAHLRKFRFNFDADVTAFQSVVRHDRYFLQGLGLVDYCILAGVRECGTWEMSISDILTPCTTKSKLVQAISSCIPGKKSTSEVVAYADQFEAMVRAVCVSRAYPCMENGPFDVCCSEPQPEEEKKSPWKIFRVISACRKILTRRKSSDQ